MSIDAHLESQYNARAAVPEHPAIQADWLRRSEALRARLRCKLDLAYGDSERQKLDLFYAESAHAPLHVYLHGGYWQRGERQANHFMAEGLCGHGVNVAMLGYDLCPSVSLGAIVDQVRAALVWLWRNAPELAVDVERIQVCGHSAGGHLSAMLMATHWPDLGADLPADLLHSGLAISGLYDLEPLRHTSINEAVGLNAETAARYSPGIVAGPGRGPLQRRCGWSRERRLSSAGRDPGAGLAEPHTPRGGPACSRYQSFHHRRNPGPQRPASGTRARPARPSLKAAVDAFDYVRIILAKTSKRLIYRLFYLVHECDSRNGNVDILYIRSTEGEPASANSLNMLRVTKLAPNLQVSGHPARRALERRSVVPTSEAPHVCGHRVPPTS